jgi:serine/threonine protein kinase/ABC-type branched-subunit amino acid transport system substrate-binding protein
MECPYCKAENRDGVRYCGSCGKLLGTTIAFPMSTPGGSSSSRALVVGSRLQGGRYVVKKVLGQGGMGAALLATDIRLDSKLVVIKEMLTDSSDPTKLQDEVRNFKREVATLAHIDHPLIPNVTDHFQEGSRYFMVQEYVEGENLEERLNRLSQPLKEREVLIYASQVLDILDYLSQQAQAIVHRDIKPANIIIGAKDKRAHLVDFGIARVDAVRNSQRKQTAALGTPGYAPPEQYQGNADPRSDLYALAATIHHLLTNRDPRNHPPFTYPPVRTLNPQLTPEIERVLTRALMNDVKQRYQSASVMKHEIDTILRQHFGVSESLDSYTLGTSSMIGLVSAAGVSNTPTALDMTQQNTVVNPLSAQSSSSYPTLVSQPPVSSYSSYPTPPSQLSLPGSYNAAGAFPGSGQGGSRILGNKWIVALAVIVVFALLFGGLYGSLSLLRQGTKSAGGTGGTVVAATPTASIPASGIGVTKVGNEYIGISDGSFAFDTSHVDGKLKTQAAASFKRGDVGSAVSLWNQAVSEDSSDAEALIYMENQRVVTYPHVTFVVATMLSGPNGVTSTGHDNLQGAYVAQKEYNDGAKLTGGVLVNLLIASSGSQSSYVPQVARQIVQLAKADPTFVGVMGWPYSSRTFQAVQILTAAHIPLVSQTSSSDALTRISPYFFRVAPSNKLQGISGAKYAEQALHAKNVALFVDVADPYSQTLAQDFTQQFQANGNKIVATEQYTVGKSETIASKVQDALKANPDLIYFSGYANDVSALLVKLPPGNLLVMGGDALYELGGYPNDARAGFSRLRFTAFAYPDEWDILGFGARKPAFFKEFPAAFNPNGQHPNGVYSFTRADNDTILSYDASIALFEGFNNVLKSGKRTVTPEDLQQGLKMINGAKSLQGVSGQISFGPDGDPVNKAIVILYVDTGHIKMEPTIQGQFLK